MASIINCLQYYIVHTVQYNDTLIIILYYDVTSLCQSLFVNNEVISVLHCIVIIHLFHKITVVCCLYISII